MKKNDIFTASDLNNYKAIKDSLILDLIDEPELSMKPSDRDNNKVDEEKDKLLSIIEFKHKLFALMNINSEFSYNCAKLSISNEKLNNYIDDYIFNNNMTRVHKLALKGCIDTILNDRNIFLRGSTNRFTQQQRISNISTAIEMLEVESNYGSVLTSQFSYLNDYDLWNNGCYAIIGTPYAGKQIIANSIIEKSLNKNLKVHNIQCGERSDVRLYSKIAAFKHSKFINIEDKEEFHNIEKFLKKNHFFETSIRGDLVELITYIITMCNRKDVVIINSINLILSSIESDGASKGGLNKKAIESVLHLLNRVGEQLGIIIIPVLRVTSNEIENDVLAMVLGVTWGYISVNNNEVIEYVNREETHKVIDVANNNMLKVANDNNDFIPFKCNANNIIYIDKNNIIKNLSHLNFKRNRVSGNDLSIESNNNNNSPQGKIIGGRL